MDEINSNTSVDDDSTDLPTTCSVTFRTHVINPTDRDQEITVPFSAHRIAVVETWMEGDSVTFVITANRLADEDPSANMRMTASMFGMLSEAMLDENAITMIRKVEPE